MNIDLLEFYANDQNVNVNQNILKKREIKEKTQFFEK